MLKITDLKIGQTVLFGRPHGEKTLAKVKRLNAATATVETLETRGHNRPAAQSWRVPYSLLYPATAAAPAAPVTLTTPQPLGSTAAEAIASAAAFAAIGFGPRTGTVTVDAVEIIKLAERAALIALEKAGFTK